jgi:ABC-type sugar transport system substrate-binding protein
MNANERRRLSAGSSVLALLCLAAFGAGCGSDDSSSGSSTAAKETTPASAAGDSSTDIDGKGYGVAVIGYANGNTYSDTLTKAAKDEAQRIGAPFTAYDGKFNPGAQVKACQDAISSGRYKVIVIGAVSGVAAVPCATAAKAAKVTLVQVGTAIGTDNSSQDATVDGVTTSVNLPMDLYTQTAADQIAAACKGLKPCRVVELSVLKTLPDYENSFQRGLKKVKSANPDIEVVATPEGGFDAGGGQKAMQDVLSKGTQFDVLFSNGAKSLDGAVIALQSAGKKLGSGPGEIRVVSMGGDRKQVARVRDKTYWSTSPTLPVEMGKYAVDYGVLAAQGKPIKRGYNPNVLAKVPLSFDQKTIAEYPDFTGEF